MNIFENALKIDVNLPEPTHSQNSIILSGCFLTTDETKPYSELEEISYCLLNANNYGLGRLDMEFRFDGAQKYNYKEFKINCVAIRDSEHIIYKQPPMKAPKGYTKITKDGKCAVGIMYYFQRKEHIDKLLNGNDFIIEFALSLGCSRNTYQVLCRFVKENNEWSLKEGNTYRLHKIKHIDNFIH